ncbi:MAG TPA: DUF4249 domain-containing protein [Puia sp.]|nr:DUF4249 domain-containing protein [Puia sp.]
MRRKSIQRSIFVAGVIFIAMLDACVQTYVSPYKSPPTGYLVVEGYISGNGTTSFTLSRTMPLGGDSAAPRVTGAALQVEGSDNSVYPLTEEGNGLYSTDSLPLTTAVKYRLRIATPDGDAYLSEYVPYRPTPPIDSVHWVQNSNGVSIYVNTHDPANATRYYQWSYDQTYQYTAAEQSGFIYDTLMNSVVPRPDSLQIFNCWKDEPSTDIAIATSSRLQQDEIYAYRLVQIAPNTQPLSVLYSILVRQYALTDSAYEFLSLMQKNSESLGSIFDAQPTQVSGNIHSMKNPGEQVIGYVSAGTLQQQRIFISNNQLKNWEYFYECGDADTLVSPNPDSVHKYFATLGFIPTYQNFGPRQPLFGWFANQAGCLDCRMMGGLTVRPTYWPN